MDKPDVDSHRGPVAGDLDRPEGRQPQPALDGRHGHRDLRLPAPAVRPRRPAALPEVRAADPAADRSSRSSTRCWRCSRARGSWSWRRWSRPQGRVPAGLRRRPQGRLRAGARRRRGPRRRRRDQARQVQEAHIEVVVDRLVVPDPVGPTSSDTDTGRIADSVEQALKLGTARSIVRAGWTGEEQLYSEQFACVYGNISLRRDRAAHFSFNSPHGACPDVHRPGHRLEIDPDLVIPNRTSRWPRARSSPGARPA